LEIQNLIPIGKQDHQLIAIPNGMANKEYQEILKKFSEGIETLIKKYTYI